MEMLGPSSGAQLTDLAGKAFASWISKLKILSKVIEDRRLGHLVWFFMSLVALQSQKMWPGGESVINTHVEEAVQI